MMSIAMLSILAAAYILWGTAQTLSLKWANSLAAPDRFSFTSTTLTVPTTGNHSSNNKVEEEEYLEVRLLWSFAHPFSQAFFMFCAEFMCLVVYGTMYLYKKYHRADVGVVVLRVGEDVPLPCNPTVWLLPGGADFLASVLQNIGLTLTYASVYQMLRGSTVLWMALLSYFWLKKRFTRVELFGMLAVMIGLTLVGLSNVLSSSGSSSGASNPLVGNILILTAQVLHAYQGVCEERLFKLYKIPPLLMVGMEGLYGVCLSLTLLAFFQVMPTVRWGHNLNAIQETLLNSQATASYTDVSWLVDRPPHTLSPYDDIIQTFDQLRSSTACAVVTVLYMFSGFFYNSCQLTIIKHLSAAATVMLGTLRNITVWGVCLLIPSVFGERFSVIQFIGFLFLVLGNVLFQRVWITRFDEVLPARFIQLCPWLLLDGHETDTVHHGNTTTIPSHHASTNNCAALPRGKQRSMQAMDVVID